MCSKSDLRSVNKLAKPIPLILRIFDIQAKFQIFEVGLLLFSAEMKGPEHEIQVILFAPSFDYLNQEYQRQMAFRKTAPVNLFLPRIPH